MRPSNISKPIHTALLLTLLLFSPLSHAALNISAATPINKARINELVPVEFLVTNTDGVSRTGVVVEMLYPANLVQVFESQFDGDCPGTSCSPGETVTWNVGTLPAGGATTLSLPVFLQGAAVDGASIDFAPTVSDDSLDSAGTSTSIIVDVDLNYDILLADYVDPATAGSQVTYKLTYGYSVNAAAVSLSTLRFPLPAGTTFVSATGGGSLVGANVDWALGILQPGDGGVREVTVTLDGGLAAGDVIAASAEIFANL